MGGTAARRTDYVDVGALAWAMKPYRGTGF
jgi:hypothetical protein